MKVIVVGGGWAGCSAALSAKKQGADVVLLERTDMLLGTGLVGGIIGIVFGTMLSGALPALMGDMRMFGSSIVSLESVIMALSVSLFVGIVAGIVPAYQASKLKPVDALRYE